MWNFFREPGLVDGLFEDDVAVEGGGTFDGRGNPRLQGCVFESNSLHGDLGEPFDGRMVDERADPLVID